MIFKFVVLSSLLCWLPAVGVGSLLADEQPIPPIQLVRATVANEIATGNVDGLKHIFRDRKSTPQGSQTRIYVETRDGMAGMTIAYNDKPLTPKQIEDEKGRLAGLVSDPAQLRRKQREQKEDSDRSLRIMRAMPEAFVFEYDGTVPGTAAIGRDGVNLIRLKFRPNPSYRPPTHVEQVLSGMSGTILIDPLHRRLAEIDGNLFQTVGFGWGILGRLDKGGHFLVTQADVGDNCWELSRMSLAFTGKILLIKNIFIRSDEVFSNFRRVPNDTTFAQGVKMLETESARFAQGGPETADAQKVGH
ncbi:MAG: hypothetical protein WA824_12020 [Candidatus Sulfotelmatobacter sp.]